MSRQQEIVAWRNVTMTNLVIRWFFTTVARYWFVTIPFLGWFFFDLVTGVLLALLCGYGYWQVCARRRARLADLHEQAGGEYVYCQMQSYAAAWPSTARAVGLTQQPEAEALGVVSAADRHLAPLQHKLNADAFGRDDHQVPKLVGIGPSNLGIQHVVQLLPGQTFEQFAKAAPALAEIWAVEAVRVQRGEPGYVHLTPVTTDPLAEVIEITPETLVPADSLEGIPVGFKEDGTLWKLRLNQTSAVIGGLPGSGKSVLLNVALANIAHREDVQIAACDFKGGLEMMPWRARCGAVAVTQDEAKSVLRSLLDIHDERLRMLAAADKASMSNLGHTKATPLWVLVVDECAEMFAPEVSTREAKTLAGELESMVSRLVRHGRATGIIVWLSTQRPDVQTVPGAIRDNCGEKVCARVTTSAAATCVVGDGLAEAEFRPTQIPKNAPGVAVAFDDDGVLRRVRSFYINEVSRRAVAQRYAHLTQMLDVTTASSLYHRPDEDDDVLLPPRTRPYAHPGLPEGVVPCDRSGGPLHLVREEA